MDFSQACAEAAMIPEFVENYNRLTGNNLKPREAKTPFEAAIDQACNVPIWDEGEVRKFADFFYEFVWTRLPEEAFKKIGEKGTTPRRREVMGNEWTFEQLSELDLRVLKRIRSEIQDRLADLRNERFAIAAQILFYQDKIRKETP